MQKHAAAAAGSACTSAAIVQARKAAAATTSAEGKGVGLERPSSEPESAPSMEDVTGCITSFSQLQNTACQTLDAVDCHGNNWLGLGLAKARKTR